MTTFTVRNWNNDQIISTHETLSAAKKACRDLGHEDKPYGGWYPPVAYVWDEQRQGCCYNPKFAVKEA